MPTYLVHGFRWPRRSILIHIIHNDLEDAAPDWIMNPAGSQAILSSFYTLYDFLPASSPPTTPTPTAIPPPPPIPPEGPQHTLTKRNKSMASLRNLGRKQKPANGLSPLTPDTKDQQQRPNTGKESEGHDRSKSNSTVKSALKPVAFNDWSPIKLLEQHDPDNLVKASQPFAYVADYMVLVQLGASVSEEMAKYAAEANDWFERLRDEVHPGAEIGWHVVVCGDEEREVPGLETQSEVQKEEPGRGSVGSAESEDFPQRVPKSAGLRNIFGRRKTISDA